MRKHDAMRVELERAAENSPRCEYHVRSRAFGKNLLTDYITVMIGKNRDHAFFAQIAHHQQKVLEQFLALCPEGRSGKGFPHAIMDQLAHHQQSVDPLFAKLCRLP